MVWGMSIPYGGGDYSPYGDVEYDKKTREEGWYERLRLYYLAQTPEEQKRLFNHGSDQVGYGPGYYPGYAVQKFLSEPGVINSGSHGLPLSPIEPHEVPICFVTEKSHHTLASFMFGGPSMMVDEALKAIIERLEPGVHQFFPIEIRTRKGTVYPVQYYTFVMGQYLDSFAPDKSDEYSWRPNGPNDYFHEKTKAGIIGLAFSKSVFGKAHLWKERRMSLDPLFFSDELIAEIANAGLRIPKHYKMKEV